MVALVDGNIVGLLSVRLAMTEVQLEKLVGREKMGGIFNQMVVD